MAVDHRGCDINELAISAAGVGTQHLEGDVFGRGVALHQDAFGSFGDGATSVTGDEIGLVCNRDAFCFMSASSRSIRSVRDLL